MSGRPEGILREIVERTLAEGNEIITLDAAEAARWVEAVKGLPDAYVDAMNELGLPGDKLIADLRDAIESYR